MPLFDVRTVEEHMKFSVFIPSMASTMLGGFGALALFLATVGLYSVIAFTVAQQTHEIGVRMALGADRGDVVRMVLRQGLVLTGLGLLIGVVLTAGVTRILSDQLIGVGPGDPASWAATLLLLTVVTLAACIFPALRAASLDPLRALRRD